MAWWRLALNCCFACARHGGSCRHLGLLWGLDVVPELESLFVVMTVAALAPVVTRLLPFAIPQVVVLLAGGVLVGPQVLDWAQQSYLQLLSNHGLGFLLLMAC